MQVDQTKEKYIGKYQILKTLGSGGTCKVKLGFDKELNKKFAIKILKDDLSEKTKKLVLEEVATMQKLKHEHVLEQQEFGTGVYSKTNAPDREVSYIVLNLASAGELFDFISASGAFPEPLARYFFK